MSLKVSSAIMFCFILLVILGVCFPDKQANKSSMASFVSVFRKRPLDLCGFQAWKFFSSLTRSGLSVFILA